MQEPESRIVPIGDIHTIASCRGHGVEYISILRPQYHVVIARFQGLIEHQNTLFFAWKVEKQFVRYQKSVKRSTSDGLFLLLWLMTCIARRRNVYSYGIDLMSVDIKTVKRVARLSRIAVKDDEAERMARELNAILGFVEQLDEVDVNNVEPLTSVIPMSLRTREDVVTDGNKAADIVANAPLTEDHFFLVPKVIE